jgi:hypothetical protein
MSDEPKKKGFDKLGYGALALYASLVAVVGLGVYGINMSTSAMDQTRSDRARAQMQNGRMVVITQDRTQCRSVRFNNETAELGAETLVDCDPHLATGSDSSFNIFSDGFKNR